MQVTAGVGQQYNQAAFTAYLNAVNALGAIPAITEFDVQDDMFEGSGVAGIAQRDTAIATAYRNYFAGVKAASQKPGHAMVWQYSDLDNWLDINGIGLRSDGLPQRPDLVDLNYSQKPSGITFLSWLQSYTGSSGAITINDALPHQIPATLTDQWGAAMSLSTLAWSSSNPTFIPVTTGGVVQASAGSQSAVITAAANQVTPPLSQSVTVATAAPVLTGVALAPGNATISSGTLQETATETDQYQNALSGIGGGVAVMSAGAVATAASSVAAIASEAAQLWDKGRILVDSLRALAPSTGFGLLAIDSDGAGTNKKFEVYGQTNAAGKIQFVVASYITGSVRQLVLGTPFVALAAFPAAGNYVEWFGSVDVTNNLTAIRVRDPNGNLINDGTSSTSGAGVVVPTFTGSLVTSGIISIGSSTISIQATTLVGTITVGSTFVISGTTYTVTTATTASGQVLHSIPVTPNTVATYSSGTPVTSMAGGAFNTTGSNGLVRLNHGLNAIAVAQAITHDGVACYHGAAPSTANEWSKPLAGDANIAAGWYQGDATNGALTTAAAFAGGVALNYSGTAVGGLSDANGWSAAAGPSYVWTSDNTLAGTVASGPGSNQGTVSFVAVGSAHVTATVAGTPNISGSALITFGAPAAPFAVTVVPSVVTLAGAGSTVQLTPTVTDQFGNVLAAAVTYASSNTAAATVSAGGLVTWAGIGTATITITVSGTSPVLSTTAAVSATAPVVTHEPAAMTPQINTGIMTALPAGLTMLSPATWGAPFQTGQAANLAPVPSGQGTGLRVTYPSILPGGFSPVRFSFALATPSPQIYVRYLIRYSPNWTNNGNTGTGMFAPQFSGNNNAGNENDLLTGRCDNPPMVDQYVVVQQQGQTTRTLPAVSSTVAAADPNGNMAGPTRGSWHLVEALFTPQTNTATANGGCTVWMDGTQCFTAANVNWVSGADSPNWATLLCDPTYGGTVSPPAVSPAMYWDFDQLYLSTLGGSNASNMPAGMTVLLNTGPITAGSTNLSIPNHTTGPFNLGGPGPNQAWTVNNSPTGTFGLAALDSTRTARPTPTSRHRACGRCSRRVR